MVKKVYLIYQSLLEIHDHKDDSTLWPFKSLVIIFQLSPLLEGRGPSFEQT